MPEGPEVRRYADALATALEGEPILELSARTRAAKAWLADHPSAFPDRRVLQVRAHGKHLIGHVEGDLFFHAHLMMWGRWQVVAPDDPLARERDRRERARIVVPDAVALLMSAPVFDLGAGPPEAAVPHLATLGPDILPYAGAFDADAFFERLDAHDAQDRTIGSALLDQRVLAGVGNYLRAEILFVCRIDPWRKVASLTDEDRDCLRRTIPMLARRAYQTQGRTVPDDVQQRMRRDPALVYQPGRDWGTRHFVFRRTNLPCLRCDDVIRQLRQVTRVTEDGEQHRIIYFCPTCQQTSVEVKPPKPRAGVRKAPTMGARKEESS